MKKIQAREAIKKQKQDYENALQRTKENTEAQLKEQLKSPEIKRMEKNQNVSELQEYASSKENYKKFKSFANNVISDFKINKTKISTKGTVLKYKNLEAAKKGVNNAIEGAKRENQSRIKIESAVKRNTEMLDKAAQEKKKARENAAKRMNAEKEIKEKQ
jgi:hypothetical protein